MRDILKWSLAALVLFPGMNPEVAYAQAGWQKPSFTEFASSAEGFRMQYPSDWEEARWNKTLIAFIAPQENASDGFQENVNLITQDLTSAPQDLENFTKKGLEEMRRAIPGATFLDSSPVQWAGLPAHRVVLTVSQGPRRLKFMQVWSIKDHRAYIFSYTAEENHYARYLGDVQRMMDSFRFA